MLLPWVFGVLFGSSCFLPLPLRWWMLGVQALFYGLAALDPLLPARYPVKRISSFARTFVSLMIAAVYRLSVFFVSPRSLWQESTSVAKHPL